MIPMWMSRWAYNSRNIEILNVFCKTVSEQWGFSKYNYIDKRGMAYIGSVSFRAPDGNVWTEEVFEADYCLIGEWA